MYIKERNLLLNLLKFPSILSMVKKKGMCFPFVVFKTFCNITKLHWLTESKILTILIYMQAENLRLVMGRIFYSLKCNAIEVLIAFNCFWPTLN